MAPIPSPVSLFALSKLYDELVDTLLSKEEVEDEQKMLHERLLKVCDLLLATQQLSSDQESTIRATKEQCSSVVEEVRTQKISVQLIEYENFSFQWSVDDNGDEDEEDDSDEIDIKIDREQLATEENELLAMANTPLP